MSKKRVRLCPICRNRITHESPRGREFTTQDGRQVVALVWTHKARGFTCSATDRPPPCSATWPKEDATPERLVIREAR